MQEKGKRWLQALLPWVLLLVALTAITLMNLGERGGLAAFRTSVQKNDLLSTMRLHLLEATGAEKSAVLAVTSEAAEEFAAQARQASDDVESGRVELESIIRAEKAAPQMTLLNEFNTCWSQFKTLDEELLALATQNTNSKARRLSVTACADEMSRFDESLNRLIERGRRERQWEQVIAPAYDALVHGLHVYALHGRHIEELEDREMDRLEQVIKADDDSARKAFAALHDVAALADDADLKNAEGAYDRFMSLTGEVLRLSRMNTNPKSVELSFGKKRLIALQCQEILATLQSKVDAARINATR